MPSSYPASRAILGRQVKASRTAWIDGWLSLVVALLAMFGVVTFVVQAARQPLWVVPAAACLAIAAYACARLYTRLFYARR